MFCCLESSSKKEVVTRYFSVHYLKFLVGGYFFSYLKVSSIYVSLQVCFFSSSRISLIAFFVSNGYCPSHQTLNEFKCMSLLLGNNPLAVPFPNGILLFVITMMTDKKDHFINDHSKSRVKKNFFIHQL